MKKSLPARPNLEYLRTRAKQLLSELRAGDPAAARIFIERLPSARRMTLDEARRAGFRLADAQSAIAREAGFAAWPGLARHVEQLRAFEGEWRFVSLEIDGRAMPPAMASQSCILIDGDRFRVQSPEAEYDGIFTLDVEARPPRIDIEFVAGPEAGNWSYGIYQLHDDDLVLCLGLAGAPRPERFATTPGSQHALERLKRSSAARPDAVDGGRSRARTETTPVLPAPDADEASFVVEMTPLLERLQGEWTPLTLITDGKALPQAMLAYGSRSMSGNETKVVFGGQVMVHARIRIDESQTPIAVDYLNAGRGPKTVTKGIMELVNGGEVVRFCMASPGKPRPGEFTSEPDSGRIFSEWKRT